MKNQSLTSIKTLTGNVVYNLISQGLPLVIAIFSIPLLINRLGTERFGILTLAWLITSYFSLFDLGLGRALTQLISEKLGSQKKEPEIISLIWTSLLLITLLGILGASIFAILSPTIVFSFLKVSTFLQRETLTSFYILALAIPFVTSTSAFVGILSALQRFDLISIVRIPFGLSTFLFPLFATYVSSGLVPVILSLLIIRVIVWISYFILCNYSISGLVKNISFDKASLLPLIKFGGWMTITNLIGPIMVYIDRIFIGSFISVNAVTFYTIPYELVTKLWLFPTALVSVLFPAFSNSFASDPKKTAKIFEMGLFSMLIVLFPIILIISTFSSEILRVWVGEEFAKESSFVLILLSIGVLLNSIAQMPFALIQGIGKPDLTAKLHLIELPFYLISFIFLSKMFAINGIAIAWTLRVFVDLILLFYFSSNFIPCRLYLLKYNISLFTFVSISFVCSTYSMSLCFRIFCVLVTLILFLYSSWKYILKQTQRQFMIEKILDLNLIKMSG